MYRLLFFLVVSLCFSHPLYAQTDEACTPVHGHDAQAVLQHAIDAVGLNHAANRVLHYVTIDVLNQNYQSDRSYPPYLMAMQDHDLLYDPSTGTERSTMRLTYPGMGRRTEMTVMRNATKNVMVRDDQMIPVPFSFGADRHLNPWAVLFDFQQSDHLVLEQQCTYRDFPRLVLERATETGPERLYLDPKTHFPVKLDREEAHYLWGQVHVEYVYATWWQMDTAFVPLSSNRLVDGEAEILRTTGIMEWATASEEMPLRLDEHIPALPDQTPAFLRPTPPDTVQVSEQTYLLANRGYTEAITYLEGTLYVLDATQGEARAQQDHDWAKQLFNLTDDTPIVLVVTDLAWPHIAGVRYWVAQGATVVSHAMSESLLRRVVERPWTRAPDVLEARRREVTFSFRGVEKATSFANGKLLLYPLDGIGSEGAINAFVQPDRFLWAGDYIQTLDEPSSYATDVYRAAMRERVNPEQTAAQHLPLTPWHTITTLAK